MARKLQAERGHVRRVKSHVAGQPYRELRIQRRKPTEIGTGRTDGTAATVLSPWVLGSDGGPAVESGFRHCVPDHNLRWLSACQLPPPGTSVWLRAVRVSASRINGSASLAMVGDKPMGYFVIFSIGYLIFRGFGHDLADPEDGRALREHPTLNPPPALRQTITDIWLGNG